MSWKEAASVRSQCGSEIHFQNYYGFIDTEDEKPYYTVNNINLWSWNGGPWHWSPDFIHNKDIYYDYVNGLSLGTQYKKELHFKAKTFHHYAWQQTKKDFKLCGGKKADVIVETRIQCLECKNIDSVKQSLDINGGGDYTCANFGIYQCQCKKTKLIIYLRNISNCNLTLQHIISKKLSVQIRNPPIEKSGSIAANSIVKWSQRP
jgi:hypothetical protein